MRASWPAGRGSQHRTYKLDVWWLCMPWRCASSTCFWVPTTKGSVILFGLPAKDQADHSDSGHLENRWSYSFSISICYHSVLSYLFLGHTTLSSILMTLIKLSQKLASDQAIGFQLQSSFLMSKDSKLGLGESKITGFSSTIFWFKRMCNSSTILHFRAIRFLVKQKWVTNTRQKPIVAYSFQFPEAVERDITISCR